MAHICPKCKILSSASPACPESRESIARHALDCNKFHFPIIPRESMTWTNLKYLGACLAFYSQKIQNLDIPQIQITTITLSIQCVYAQICPGCKNICVALICPRIPTWTYLWTMGALSSYYLSLLVLRVQATTCPRL